jgi:hypothetical protein
MTAIIPTHPPDGANDIALYGRTRQAFNMIERDLRLLKALPAPRSPEVDALIQVVAAAHRYLRRRRLGYFNTSPDWSDEPLVKVACALRREMHALCPDIDRADADARGDTVTTTFIPLAAAIGH